MIPANTPTITQEQFEQRYAGQWDALEEWLRVAENPKTEPQAQLPDDFDFPTRYRQLAQHLALARARHYSPGLINRLSHLAQQCHDRLYGNQSHFANRIAHFYLRTLPQTVRREWPVVTLAAIIFLLPLIGLTVAIQIQPDLAYSVVEDGQLRQAEQSYGGESMDARESEQSFFMFGYYISNNTGIGFRTFAGGVVFGIGSLVVLLFNGLVIGAVAGHLTELGHIENFWGFVSGHSGPELSAIILSGAAGFRLGWALIAPGRLPRLVALRESGKTSVALVYGAATLFFISAFVEAFWSPLVVVPFHIKLMVGGAGWLLIWAYLLFTGRASGGKSNAPEAAS
ncbi:MAG: stage II sporulation protein M [Gammaproteobacteria bacterium]